MSKAWKMSVNAIERSWLEVRRLAQRYSNAETRHDLNSGMPLRVYAHGSGVGRVLVTTNDPALRRSALMSSSEDLASVVVSGYVSSGQAAAIARLSSGRFGPIAFVGDADPLSLHIFVSLREYMGPAKIAFCGICDRMLAKLNEARATPAVVESLEQSAFDRAHLRVLRRLTELEDVVGPEVSAVLASGRKIELEALSFRADVIPAFFRLALMEGRRRPTGLLGLKRRRR